MAGLSFGKSVGTTGSSSVVPQLPAVAAVSPPEPRVASFSSAGLTPSSAVSTRLDFSPGPSGPRTPCSRVLDAGSVDRMGLSTASTPSAPPLNTQCPSECAFYSPRVFRRLRTGTLPVLLRVHNPGMPNRNPRVPPADSLRHHHQALQTPPSRDPPTQLVCSSPHPSEHFRPGRLPGSRLRA